MREPCQSEAVVDARNITPAATAQAMPKVSQRSPDVEAPESEEMRLDESSPVRPASVMVLAVEGRESGLEDVKQPSAAKNEKRHAVRSKERIAGEERKGSSSRRDTDFMRVRVGAINSVLTTASRTLDNRL